MKRYGCIGKKLGHSFSREIHGRLADYPYELIELAPEQVAPFFEKKDFAAVNVTIPYKQTVIPHLDVVSPVAQRIGAVNTVVNTDGVLYGYNTDYYGMKALLERTGIDPAGKKVLILGTGGTGRMARVLAEDLGAAQILTVSRTEKAGCITYAQAEEQHRDARVIINTTPVGMYPDCDAQPIGLDAFGELEGLIDVVYNPLRTDLVLDARKRGIRAEGGLYMLVMQAVVAVERFLNKPVPREAADRVFASVLAAKENLVLTGMPGSGKSTVGRLVHPEGFAFVDTDGEIESRCGCPIRALIEEKGERCFRDLETRVIREVSAGSGLVIATGGGAVLREENVRCLRRNGRLFFLEADLSRLEATDARPLSDTRQKLEKLYRERLPVYRRTADVTVPELESPQAEAAYIIQKREEGFR